MRGEITGLVSETFFANLVVQTDKEVSIDCRPSDALALVVRTGAPIFVDEEILNEVGIQPEDAIYLEPENEEEEEYDLPGNLSVFEDFLGKIDQEDDSEGSTSSEDAPEDPE